jgi:predicted nucleic acid-binding protein
VNSRIFVDTNIFVYWVHDQQDAQKHVVARQCLDYLISREAGRISPQVVGEFLRACARKLRAEITREEAHDAAGALLETFPLVVLDGHTTAEALRVSSRYQLDFYDAQVWAAARVSGCDVILTEDTHGDSIESVRYVNPFVPGFDLKTLLRD